jgi:hypothetical protein
VWSPFIGHWWRVVTGGYRVVTILWTLVVFGDRWLSCGHHSVDISGVWCQVVLVWSPFGGHWWCWVTGGYRVVTIRWTLVVFGERWLSCGHHSVDIGAAVVIAVGFIFVVCLATLPVSHALFVPSMVG